MLSADYYEQINSNSLNGGETAGVNTIPMKNNALRYHYRFVTNGEKTGFERNCDESTQVYLESKDEVYLTVNGNDNHFFGNWTWETEDKNWISWAGQTIADYPNHVNGIVSTTVSQPTTAAGVYDLQCRRLVNPQKSKVLYIVNGKKLMVQ